LNKISTFCQNVKIFLRARLPGGLDVGTVVICADIADIACVSGAATVSLGIIALPATQSFFPFLSECAENLGLQAGDE
jgi:TRAP-type mannitol/chloroaromatic compound transport system permease large subunit